MTTHRPPRHPAAGRAAPALAATALMLLLTGCYHVKDTTGSIPNDYRERHPITVKEGERTVELLIGRSRGGLTPSQRADVLAFTQVWKREATGGVIVDIPSGTPNAMAANDALREVQSIFAAAGIPPSGVSIRPYMPRDPGGLASLRLSYSKFVAEAGPCGLWPHDLGPSQDGYYFTNKPYWNLGCATQRNFAAMVDNPGDLVTPRGESPVSASRRSIALDKYRKGENPAGLYPDWEKSKLSDVGK